MGELVGNHIRDSQEFWLSSPFGIDQQNHFAERHTTKVFHRTKREVGHGDQVEFLARVWNAVVVGEVLQREGTGFESERSEMSFADGVDDAQRYAVDVHRIGRFERTDDECHQVGRHLDGGAELDGSLGPVVSRDLGNDRTVGRGEQIVQGLSMRPRMRPSSLVRRSMGRLDEHPCSRTGSLRSCALRLFVGEGRDVKPGELAVQDAVETR